MLSSLVLPLASLYVNLAVSELFREEFSPLIFKVSKNTNDVLIEEGSFPWKE